MRRTSQVALFALAIGAFSPVMLGQSGNGQGKGQDKTKEHISHVGVAPNGNTVHHFFSVPREKEYQAQKAALAANGACPPTCPVTGSALVYNGGPVMRNPTNYLIFWVPQAPGGNPNVSAGFPAGFQTAMENVFQNLSGTPYYNIVTQYNDKSAAVVPNSESLGAPSWTDATTVPPSGCDGTPTGTVGTTPHCPLTDADIQSEVTTALKANPAWIQPPNINAEYFVFTPTGIGECSNQVSSVWQCFAINGGVGPSQKGAFCAYHSAFNTSSTSGTIYAYQPFAADGSCFGNSTATPNLANFPNGVNVDAEASPVTHEMIESNTDPLPGVATAWQGVDLGADEIGDKCAYNYGYVAPDGTNVVLSGQRFQIQQEFSNDLVTACGGATAPVGCACTKRYGADPGLVDPTSMDFSEVDAGQTLEKDLVIQNTAGGDLNILNVRLGPSSSSDYTLLNVPPSSATLHASESLTVQVRFAPPTGASFAHPPATVFVDTDQTTFNTSTQAAGNEQNTAVTGTVGVAPTAACKNVTVNTDLNLCTTAVASVNNGSTDPDGETITVTQSPGGPYTLGATPVTLLVNDSEGVSASCAATVTVQDHQAPTITCPAPQTIMCTSNSGAAATLNPTVFDNCPAVTSSCAPPSGSTFGFGTTPVTCTATDSSGNMSSCATSVTVTDIPPVIQSVTASPALLSPPNKKLVPVNILVKDSDVCDPSPVCTITKVTANQTIPASYIQITGPLTVNLANAGNGGHPLTYTVTVTCADHHGGSTTAQTSVTSE